MARARIIKPGFFKNEDLGALPPLTRLLFSGIWTIADRAGRLEDRPKKIKAELLPYDDCDGEEMIASLAATGFLVRYECAGMRYLQVVNWTVHQQPHVKEQASTIPAPPAVVTSTEDAPDMQGANTVQTPDMHVTSTEDAPLDTRYQIPDTRPVTDNSKKPGKREEGAPAPAPAPARFSPSALHLSDTELASDAADVGVSIGVYRDEILPQWADSRIGDMDRPGTPILTPAQWRANARKFGRRFIELKPSARAPNGNGRPPPVTFAAQGEANTDAAFDEVFGALEGPHRNGFTPGSARNQTTHGSLPHGDDRPEPRRLPERATGD